MIDTVIKIYIFVEGHRNVHKLELLIVYILLTKAPFRTEGEKTELSNGY